MASFLERITVDPAICHGQPCVRGTRVMVWLILHCMANGDTVEDILAAYPSLSREDVRACLAYAAETAKERVVSIEGSHNHEDSDSWYS